MKLPLDDKLLGYVPILAQQGFRSLWPPSFASDNPRLAELMLSDPGRVAARQGMAQSTWNALQIVFYNKATVVGDLLSSQLPAVSDLRVVKGAEQLFGVFRMVDWSAFQNNTEQALTIMAEVGIRAGLNALTGAAIGERIADVFFNFGDELVRIIEGFRKNDQVLVPWSEYGQPDDEYLTSQFILGLYSKSVDQTNLFRPPFNPGAPWTLGFAGEAGLARVVWTPWAGNEIPWRDDGVGGIPGTMRLMGQVQLQHAPSPTAERPSPLYPGLPAPSVKQQRITAAGQEMPWPPEVRSVGDFYPAAGTTCGTLWNMAEKPGAPDMYKIHVGILLDEWAELFGSMEESFAALWNPTGPNLVLGTAQIPWVAYKLKPGDKEWKLGPPWRVPSFASWVVPGLYAGERPGEAKWRTSSLWIEEALARDAKVAAWPYGADPAQHPCSREDNCSSTLGATGGQFGITHPASWKKKDGPAPPGYRKVPWPTAEMERAIYASPWAAIIKPALERLQLQQERALKATVVCAYVRPTPVAGLAPYGAFDSERYPAAAPLQQLCLDMREQLLRHPARFRVNLVDAEAIDPQFAERLRASGVTGGPGDFGKSLGRKGPIDGARPPPPGQPPQGGIPFERLPIGRPPSRPANDGAYLLLGGLATAAAVGTGIYLASRGRR